MIRLSVVISVLGLVMQGFAGVMLIPIAVAAYFKEFNSLLCFIFTSVVSFFLGFAARQLQRNHKFEDLERLEGMGVVAFGWLTVAIMGAIPYIWFEHSFIDAFFESMSGFTTTGATIFTDFSKYNRSLFFYRGFTQWLGGMGILVLFVAILPHLAVSGRQLFFAETSAASKEKLTPRISHTAQRLWGWYAALTLFQILALHFVGINWNDAVANTFATLAAGGFSPHPFSIMGYKNPAAEWVIIFFMFLAGANFTLQIKALRGQFKNFFEDAEFQFYALILFISTSILFLILARTTQSGYSLESLRAALFQNLSILTTTGFATVDFNLWPDQAKAVLFFLMFIGGCSGSAGGGIKVIRALFLIRYIGLGIFRTIHSQAVVTLRLGNRVFSKAEIQPIISFICLYFLIFGVSGTIASIVEGDIIVGYTGAIATLGNIGPGFGAIGPMGNYANLSWFTKLLFVILMWAGRLEVMTLAVFFNRDIWRGSFK